MKTLKLSIPNDYGSDSRMTEAVAECYDGDATEAEADQCREMYEVLASVAKAAGLLFVEETDFGAVWSGTAAQCQMAVAAMPDWAGIKEG